MDVLDEAKDIVKHTGCKKAYAVHKLELYNIEEVKNYSKNREIIELKKEISKLISSKKSDIELRQEELIECPLDSSMRKYLEFSLNNKSITPYNLSNEECKRTEQNIKPLLEKYHWSFINKSLE